MKRLIPFLILALVLCGVPALADVPVLQTSSNLQASGTSSSCVVAPGSTGSCVIAHCPQGQSSAVVYIPAGSSLSGTVTVYTAPDVNGAAGVYAAPLWSAASGGTTNVTTLSSFPGSLFVTLGSSQWVEAVLTTATSGSATGTITCSSAVARAPVGSSGTVTSVTGTSPITSSGGNTPAIGCATCAVTGSNNNFSASQTVTGTVQATGFNVGGSALTPCDICDGTTNALTPNILAYGAGSLSGNNTLGTTTSTITFGSTSLTGQGLALTNSVNGLSFVIDQAGSVGSNGEIRSAHSTAALRSIIGGYATAVAPISANYGDVEGSRSVSTGNLNLGGTTTNGNFDFGITTAAVFTADHQLNDTSSMVSGSGTAVTSGVSAGDMVASRSTTTGAIFLGGSNAGGSCRIDYGITNSSKLAWACGVSVVSAFLTTALITGGNLLDTGLSTTTVGPLCGASATNVSQCGPSVLACSATSGSPCHANGTCSLSSATTCNFTTTVPASSICVGESNGSDTTTGTHSWKFSLSSTTLTATITTSASQTQTAAANIICS